MAKLEICVATPADLAAAVAGGAHRVELCSALSIGGLTPSAALVEAALALCRPAGVEVHAMVRPREGDFAYGADEVGLALAEGDSLAAAGVDGLVFGAARDGALDEAVLAEWSGRFGGRGLELTLHRAIDVVDDVATAVDVAARLGFARILSSGGRATAPEGAPALREMMRVAAGRCRIAAGSGVRPDNAAALLVESGVDELHASASVPLEEPAPAIRALGFANGPRRATDPALVRALRQVVDHTHI